MSTRQICARSTSEKHLFKSEVIPKLKNFDKFHSNAGDEDIIALYSSLKDEISYLNEYVRFLNDILTREKKTEKLLRKFVRRKEAV